MARCYSYTYGYYNCGSNGWYNWGRWVLLGVIVVVFILFFFMCSCLSARRRRKAGRTPFYGTGWAAGPAPPYQPSYPQQQNYNQGWNNNQSAPPYNASNQGYYGGQAEMQTPQNTYRAGNDVYSPPTGPPPGKVN